MLRTCKKIMKKKYKKIRKKKYKKIRKKKYKKRLKSGVNFLSLPCDVVSDICSFCEANEILALSLTCQTLHKDVGNSMLHIDVTRSNIPKVWKIPIFFPDQCHSVFFTWKIVTPHRDHEHTLILVSRRRDNYGRTSETIVWKKTKSIARDTHQMFYFSFRNNPSQEYFLRHECRNANETYFRIASLEKQYIVNALTPTKKDALTACLKMGCIASNVLEPHIKHLNYFQTRADILPFFMKLFVLCFGSLSHVESHAASCFKWNPYHSLGSSPDHFLHVQKQVFNIFEQVLEQKEPAHCLKLPLSHEDVVYHSRVPSTHCALHMFQDCKSPLLLLRKEFTWNPSQPSSGLEFVARIPLFPNTRRFSFVELPCLPHPHLNKMFVLFFQKQKSSLEDLESPIVGKVLFSPPMSFTQRTFVDVDPKYESCFLYFVPDNSSTKMKLNQLEVQLEIARVQNSYFPIVHEWMELVLYGRSYSRVPLRDRLFPVALFRGVALTLLGPEQVLHTALKEALDTNQVDTTRDGLQCIVDICDVMMEE